MILYDIARRTRNNFRLSKSPVKKLQNSSKIVKLLRKLLRTNGPPPRRLGNDRSFRANVFPKTALTLLYRPGKFVDHYLNRAHTFAILICGRPGILTRVRSRRAIGIRRRRDFGISRLLDRKSI